MDTSNVTPLHGGIVAQATTQLSRMDLRRTANRAARRAERSPITVPRGMVPLRGYGNYSTRELARMCGVTRRTAQRWRRTGKAPAVIVVMLELLHSGPLELISYQWADWAIRKGKLCNIDGHEYTPGEVWGIGLLHQRIAALEASNRQLRAELDLAGRFSSQRDRSHRESKAIGKAEALCRVVFALLSELTTSEDGEPAALDGSSALVRRAQLATCQVAIELHRGGSSAPAASEAAIEAALAEFEQPADGEEPT